MVKKDKFQILQDTLDEMSEANNLLKKMDVTSASDLKKAEGILKKASLAALKDKNLSVFFYQTSGVIKFIRKDPKAALDLFQKAIKQSNGSYGEPYIWKSYVHLQLGDEQECFKWLAEAYKIDKKTKALVKNFPNFEKVKNTTGFKSALGILSKADLATQKIDPLSKQLADFILETPDWEWYQLYGLSKKNRAKFKDMASYWDAVIVALSPAVEDAKEHNLKDSEVYDDMYPFKVLKDTLKEAKAERKKLGSAKSYFLKTIKDVL